MERSEINSLVKGFGKFAGLMGIAILLITPLLKTGSQLVLLVTFLFTALVTFLSSLGIAFTFNKSHQAFMGALAGGMLAKLILGPLYILAIHQLYPNYLTLSVLTFLAFYLVFTGFEVYQLNTNLRPHFRKQRQR